jgi:hypothetical protein
MVSLCPIAWAADWPTLKAGNWTFERTVDGNKTHEVLQARRLGDCPR